MGLPSTLRITERIDRDKLEVGQCTKSKFPIPGEYIGEVLDLYKTASGNCYGSIKPALSVSYSIYLWNFPLGLYGAQLFIHFCVADSHLFHISGSLTTNVIRNTRSRVARWQLDEFRYRLPFCWYVHAILSVYSVIGTRAGIIIIILLLSRFYTCHTCDPVTSLSDIADLRQVWTDKHS